MTDRHPRTLLPGAAACCVIALLWIVAAALWLFIGDSLKQEAPRAEEIRSLESQRSRLSSDLAAVRLRAAASLSQEEQRRIGWEMDGIQVETWSVESRLRSLQALGRPGHYLSLAWSHTRAWISVGFFGRLLVGKFLRTRRLGRLSSGPG